MAETEAHRLRRPVQATIQPLQRHTGRPARGTPTAHDQHAVLSVHDLDRRCCRYPVRNFSQLSGAKRTPPAMPETLIGYARCSTDEQDLTAQQQRLTELGVAEERIYLDHGLTGTNRARPGLDQALAAVREGDTLVVPKLDRLARSVPDARAIGDDLAARGIKLSLGGQVYDPTDPMGKMFFNILATFAESRSTSGCGPAKAWPWLAPEASSAASNPSSHPNSSANSSMAGTGEYTIADLAE